MPTTYDPNEVSLTLDGVFITGFQDGTFIEASKDEDNFNTKVSAQGDVAVAFTNNPLGTITFTLSPVSPSLSYVRQLADRRTPFPAWVNRSGGEVNEKAGGTMALIKKKSGMSFSDDLEDRKFEVQVLDYIEE